jgi:hypothetical protein
LMGQHVISFVDSAYSVNYSRPPALVSAVFCFVLQVPDAITCSL